MSEDKRMVLEEAARILSLVGYRIQEPPQWWTANDSAIDLVAVQGRLGVESSTGAICLADDQMIGLAAVKEAFESCRYALTTGLIDTCLVVSIYGFDDEAVAWAGPFRTFTLASTSELLNTAMDFRPYLDSLRVGMHESSDGLPHYYMPPLTTTGDDAEFLIRRWANGLSSLPEDLPSARPVAVLGAYGIGKSSFATALAAEFAQAALDDSSARKPVLIRLGDIAGEQSLEGLIAKLFTATHPVSGYNFPVFWELNVTGGLVILLDGFDEMKQLLSWREFKYNLTQLNRLCVGKSRVVILGRPTAFETDEQHEYALHGRRRSAFGTMVEPGWPDYSEVELASLNDEQIQEFLDRYITYRGGRTAKDPAAMARLQDQIRSRRFKDLSRRPVQLRMLAEVLPKYAGDLDDLDLATLYSEFINDLIKEVIGREEKKFEKDVFTPDQRRQFLGRFAMWLWRTKENSAVTDQVPDELFLPFCGTGDLEETRRDLLVRSPLDRRAGERVRFPHRSFQEFLVAEELWEGLASGTIDLATTNELMNREVGEFMRLKRHNTRTKVAVGLLSNLTGSVRWMLVDAIFLDEPVVQGIMEKLGHATKRKTGAKQLLTGWELLVATAWSLQSSPGTQRLTLDQLVAVAQSTGDMRLRLLALFCGMRMAAHHGRADTKVLSLVSLVLGMPTTPERFSSDRVQNYAIHGLTDDLVMALRDNNVMVGRCLGQGRVRQQNGQQFLVGRDSIEVRWFHSAAVSLVRTLNFAKNGRQVDLRGIRPIFAKELRDAFFITDWLDEKTLHPSVVMQETFELSGTTATDLKGVIDTMQAAVAIADKYTEQHDLRNARGTSKRPPPRHSS